MDLRFTFILKRDFLGLPHPLKGKLDRGYQGKT